MDGGVDGGGSVGWWSLIRGLDLPLETVSPNQGGEVLEPEQIFTVRGTYTFMINKTM